LQDNHEENARYLPGTEEFSSVFVKEHKMHLNFKKRGAVVTICITGIIALSLSVKAAPASQKIWRTLEPGLDYGEFKAPRATKVGDSKIIVARIDPARFKLRIYSAHQLKTGRLPIDRWMKRYNLTAAINAGMFEPNGRPNGYTRIGNITLNPNRKSKYNAFLAIGPDRPGLPRATILDPSCDNVKILEKHYRVIMQGMRMVDCKGANLWKKSSRIWSTAALAVDGKGRILFIHSRSPWDVHDFNQILLELPMGVKRAMYLEGGPEASLAVNAAGFSILRIGSWETRFKENDNNDKPWALPNIIGVQRIDNTKRKQ
jgi:hypothetical protein